MVSYCLFCQTLLTGNERNMSMDGLCNTCDLRLCCYLEIHNKQVLWGQPPEYYCGLINPPTTVWNWFSLLAKNLFFGS